MIEAGDAVTQRIQLRYGMVGGGAGAFIGDVHRRAIGVDRAATLVAGCFSRTFDNTQRTGTALGLESDRLYRTYAEMAKKEADREDGIDFVIIVTPNVSHHAIAKAFLEQGIHVVCDKPLTLDSAQASELAALAKRKKLLFCVTYTYSGYPMVKHARQLIRDGRIGDIRYVNVEYAQEWLATPVETSGNKQASWRTDPKQTGISNVVGDIGTHAEQLLSSVTGLKIDSLCARLDTFVKGRKLDDNATIMVNFRGGARGLIWVSQVAIGNDNGLKLRVFGTKGSIEWSQEDPNYLTVAYLDAPKMVVSRGRDELSAPAASFSRFPAGHPEGYLEAFADVYRAFCDTLGRRKTGERIPEDQIEFPTVMDGAQGVKFIEKCVESSKAGATWVTFGR